MLKQQKIFFDFLRFCIGSAKEIPGSLKEVDWKELYAIAQKQALLSVLFYGIQRLPKELAPEQKLLMQWMVMAEIIRKQNIRLFQDSVKVCKNFENKGFANCILKGQGNALLYPDPYMRTPGDIDIYLAGGKKRVMQYINKVCPNQVMRYHHVDFPVMKTAIEVHFTPS
ncbi:nucleotidyltransferase family protein [Prevotella copri]|nr:nucleotidyltransferase family protein [Segatella copri]